MMTACDCAGCTAAPASNVVHNIHSTAGRCPNSPTVSEPIIKPGFFSPAVVRDTVSHYGEHVSAANSELWLDCKPFCRAGWHS
jgi:hypothetical protein